MSNELSEKKIPVGDGEIWPYRYKYYAGAGDEHGKSTKDKHRNVLNISNHNLWYADPSTLNDPFDCAPSAEERSMDKMLEMAESFLKKFPGHYPDAPNLPKDQLIIRMAEEQAQRLKGPAMVSEFRSYFSVLCLSRDPVNRLMWAHYANSHKGFALEFDVRPAIDKPYLDERLILSIPVKYSDQRPHFDGKETDIFLVKDSVWQYEREERKSRHQAAGLVEFDPKCLTSVILGVLATDQLKEQVRYHVNKLGQAGRHIKIYEVEMHKESYRIWIPNHPYFGEPDYEDPDDLYPVGDIDEIHRRFNL